MPKDVSSSDPEIMSILSDSMMLLLAWVSCNGTIANCDTVDVLDKVVAASWYERGTDIKMRMLLTERCPGEAVPER